MPSYSFQGTSREWVPRDEEENMKIFGNGRLDGIMPTELPAVEQPDGEEIESDRWPPKLLIKLLRLYGSHRCLWDHKDPCNNNRNERKAAMIDITEAMGDGITMDQISQKINVIRSTYRYEKRRIKQRIRKGQGAKTKLKWFALADSFLRHVPRSEKFRKANAEPDSDSDLEDAVVFTIDPEIMIPMEEDLAPGNQNFITIGSTTVSSEVADNAIVSDINKKVAKINKILDDREWNILDANKSLALLELYKGQKCLWDENHRFYSNKKKRNKALAKIGKEIDKQAKNKQILKGIEEIRKMYIAERKLVELEGEAETPWYSVADSFLRPFCNFTPQQKSPEGSFIDIDKGGNEDSHSCQAIDVKVEIQTDFDGNNSDADSVKLINKNNKNSIGRKWSECDSLHFVELYQKHECLWRKEYSSPYDKSDAVLNIANAMSWSVGKIEKKIKIFRKAYAAEYSRRERCSSEGISFKSDFVWFELADGFLCNLMPLENAVISETRASWLDSGKNSEMTSIKSENTEPVSLDVPIVFDSESHTGQNEDNYFDGAMSDSDCASEMSPQNPISKFDDYVSDSKSTAGMASLKTDTTKIKWQPPEDDLLEGKWSLKQSVKFLRLYGAHRCLWDLNHEDYRNRYMREAAMTDIAAVMGHGLDMEFVNKKVKIFRITYMQERKRLVDLMKQNQVPEIQLKWFPLADSFLRPHIGLRAFKDTDPQLPQFDFQYVYANLNLIDPGLLNNFEGKGSQNSIQIGSDNYCMRPLFSDLDLISEDEEK